ncbi:hypothetical protein T08_13517 [Trichinella sp. T8]|nr:hypothetical protein T08_13517 [Trichinella sp. T8]
MSEGCVHVEDVELTNGLLKTAKTIVVVVVVVVAVVVVVVERVTSHLLYFTTHVIICINV